MKCPKCQYLGFDTGTRCRNCGYDFSLLALADGADAGDVRLRSDAAPRLEPVDPVVLHHPQVQLEDLPLSLEPARAAAISTDTTAHPLSARPPRSHARRAQQGSLHDEEDQVAGEPGLRAEELPLFAAPDDESAPLLRVPPSPRPPIAVRKAPEVPRVARPPAAVRRDARPPVKAETLERRDEPRVAAAAARPPKAGTASPQRPVPRRNARSRLPSTPRYLADCTCSCCTSRFAWQD
jgi:hypothetical protein